MSIRVALAFVLMLAVDARIRLGAVAQIWVLNDCGNLYLTLAGFWDGCQLISEADVHCLSAGHTLRGRRQGLVCDRYGRRRFGAIDPKEPAEVSPSNDRSTLELDLRSHSRESW